MSSNNDFEELVLKVLNEYYTMHQAIPVNARYSIVDDMCSEYAKLRPDHASKEPEKVASLSQYNANVVPPATLEGTFTILLNRAKLLEYLGEGNMTWVGTIVHETTHVIDFIEYAKIRHANDYEDILDTGKHALFHLWTECNAKAKGYYFVRKYSFENMFDTAQIPDILNIELPEQSKLLFKNYHSTTDGTQQAYYVAHFIGRLYALNHIFPQHFDDASIEQILTPNTWMYDWYLFFRNHQNLQMAYEHFDEFRKVLNQNFSGF